MLALFIPTLTQAQITGEYELLFRSGSANDSSLPFFSHAHRRGIHGQSNPYFALGGVRTTHRASFGEFDLAVGADFFARASNSPSLHFQQLYGEIQWSDFTLWGGLRYQQDGYVYNPLTSGSIAWSENSTPFPKIGIDMAYRNVPLTGGLLQAKGRLAHGWMEYDRYTTAPMMHEKNLYLRTGLDIPLRLHTGLIHYAIYGGTTPGFGQNPSSFMDYIRVFFFLGEDDEAIDGEEYALGDHIGAWDFGLEYDLGAYQFFAYKHFIIETQKELLFNTPQDGLLGFGIRTFESGSFIDGFVYEFLYTKFQNGPFFPGTVPGQSGQKNYYNHFIYQTGWTTRGRVIGNPLLFPFEDGEIVRTNRIESNRVKAHHIGIYGQADANSRYRILFTSALHYGTYRNRNIALELGEPYDFLEGPRQYHFYMEVEHKPIEDGNLSIIGALSLDWGEVFPVNAGLILGINWNFNNLRLK